MYVTDVVSGMGRAQAGHLKRARESKEAYTEAVETVANGSRELFSERVWRALRLLPETDAVLSAPDFEAAVSAALVSGGPAVHGRLAASTVKSSFGGGRLVSARGTLALLERLGVQALENEALYKRATPLPVSRVLRRGEAFFGTIPIQQYAQQIGGLRRPAFLRRAVHCEPSIVASQTGRHAVPRDLAVPLSAFGNSGSIR